MENDIKLMVNYCESNASKKFNFKPRNEHILKLKRLISLQSKEFNKISKDITDRENKITEAEKNL